MSNSDDDNVSWEMYADAMRRITDLEAEVERLRARNRLMTELLNDVLRVTPDWEQKQVWCLNLSRSSSVGLPEKFHELWKSPDEQQ